MNTRATHKKPTVSSDLAHARPDRTLVIGNLGRWKSEGRITTALREFAFLNLDQVTPEALNDFSPDIILSPLVGDDFDVIDVADKLTECGFRGRYRVVSEGFPNTELIRREVSGHAPALDFDLLLVPQEPTEKALRDVSDEPTQKTVTKVSDQPRTVLHSVDSVGRKAQGR